MEQDPESSGRGKKRNNNNGDRRDYQKRYQTEKKLELERLKESIKRAELKNADLLRENQILSNRQGELDQEINDLRTKLSETISKEKYIELEKQNKELEQTLSEVDFRLNEAKEMKKLNREHNAIRADLMRKMDELEKRNSFLEDTVKKNDRMHGREVEKFQNQIKELEISFERELYNVFNDNTHRNISQRTEQLDHSQCAEKIKELQAQVAALLTLPLPPVDLTSINLTLTLPSPPQQSAQIDTSSLLAIMEQQRQEILKLNDKMKMFENRRVHNSNDEIYGTVATNAVHLLKNILPARSPFRRSIAHYLFDGLSRRDAEDFSGFGHTFIAEAANDDGEAILQKFQANVKRSHFKKEDLDRAQGFFDEILPVKSGRLFRVQIISDERLYQLYREASTNDNVEPLEYDSFFRYIVSSARIHHSDKAHLCKQCEKLEKLIDKKTKEGLTAEEEEELKKLIEHEQRKIIQKQEYFRMKNEVRNREAFDTCIVVQDFALIKSDSTFIQALIIAVYYKDSNDATSLTRKTFVYYPPQMGESNDVGFVKAAWNHFLDLPLLRRFRELSIWSDGGPKHFKIAECVRFLWSIGREKNKKITYNFFESYHGEAACDGAAANIMRRIGKAQKDRRELCNTPDDYVRLTKNNYYTVFKLNDIPRWDQRVQTLKGIKAHYKLDLHLPTWIFGYKDSRTTTQYDKRWHVQRDFETTQANEEDE